MNRGQLRSPQSTHEAKPGTNEMRIPSKNVISKTRVLEVISGLLPWYCHMANAKILRTKIRYRESNYAPNVASCTDFFPNIRHDFLQWDHVGMNQLLQLQAVRLQEHIFLMNSSNRKCPGNIRTWMHWWQNCIWMIPGLLSCNRCLLTSSKLRMDFPEGDFRALNHQEERPLRFFGGTTANT